MSKWVALILACVFGTIGGSTVAHAQSVRGVEFGRTTIKQLRAIRGAPDMTGRTETGRETYLKYGEWVFYFDKDSVAAFARYFPSNWMSRRDVEQVFGSSRSESRQPDLTVQAVYSDTVTVGYDRDGERATLIEYGKRGVASGGAEGGVDPLGVARVHALMESPRARLIHLVVQTCVENKFTLSPKQAEAVLNAAATTKWDREAMASVKQLIPPQATNVCDSAATMVQTVTPARSVP
jgi:hypothetical protein